MLLYVNKYDVIEILCNWLEQKDLFYLRSAATNKKLFPYLTDKLQHIKIDLLTIKLIDIESINKNNINLLKWYNNLNISVNKLQIKKCGYSYKGTCIYNLLIPELTKFYRKYNNLKSLTIIIDLFYDENFIVDILKISEKYCKNLIEFNFEIKNIPKEIISFINLTDLF